MRIIGYSLIQSNFQPLSINGYARVFHHDCVDEKVAEPVGGPSKRPGTLRREADHRPTGLRAGGLSVAVEYAVILLSFTSWIEYVLSYSIQKVFHPILLEGTRVVCCCFERATEARGDISSNLVSLSVCTAFHAAAHVSKLQGPG